MMVIVAAELTGLWPVALTVAVFVNVPVPPVEAGRIGVKCP